MGESRDLNQQVRGAQARLRLIQQQAANSNNQENLLLTEAIAQLSVALEELQVTTEELQQQNEELLTTQHMLEWERQRSQNLFDFAPDAYLVTDGRGIIQTINGAAENLLNVHHDLAVGKPLILFIAESDHPLVYAQLKRLNSPPEKSSTELAQRCAPHDPFTQATLLLQDQEISIQPRIHSSFPASLSLSKECDRQGRVVQLYWIFHDLRERKRAEQKIREQAALIDIATDAIFVQDLEGRIQFWSQGAERLYGWTAAETFEQVANELFQTKLFHHESLLQLETDLSATLNQGFWQGELEQVTKTGKSIIVASRWTLVRSESKEPDSILVVNTDITDKKQLEDQFYRAQRLESVGTLASGIAHDLNNVFTPILALSHLLLGKLQDVDPRSREMLEILGNSAERGANLVSQILNFARGTRGNHVTLQIQYLLQEVSNIVEQTFPKSIAIRREIPLQSLWFVAADPTHLHQVLINLCVNARDAMPNGGVLTLSAQNQRVDAVTARKQLDAREGNYVVITVADTGTGISPDLLDRIFDPFFTTKEPGRGTGLGLSTVMEIVRNHGGFLQIFSEMGTGTQFQVYLPAIEGAISQTPTSAGVLWGNGELILLVDDEVAVQQTNQALLENYNFTTLVANDGLEAIALYQEHQQHIYAVLMDIMMPNLDGLTAIRRLRHINPQVKLIAVSGLPSNRQQVLLAGADIFLPKPYTAQDLLMSMHELVEGQS